MTKHEVPTLEAYRGEFADMAAGVTARRMEGGAGTPPTVNGIKRAKESIGIPRPIPFSDEHLYILASHIADLDTSSSLTAGSLGVKLDEAGLDSLQAVMTLLETEDRSAISRASAIRAAEGTIYSIRYYRGHYSELNPTMQNVGEYNTTPFRKFLLRIFGDVTPSQLEEWEKFLLTPPAEDRKATEVKPDSFLDFFSTANLSVK
jgi:hypothetical protein